METKLFEEGAFVRVDSPVIEGWHECGSLKELLANQEPSEEDVKGYTLKWTGTPLPKEIMGNILALVSHFPRTEVNVCLYYSTEEKAWLAHVPRQNGSSAHVTYSDEDWQEPAGFYFSGTVHTHPEMPAFWSGTDTNDQLKHNGFHVVLSLRDGKLNDYLVSLSYNGKLYPQDKALVEIPEELPEVKQEWLERVHEELPKEEPKPADAVRGIERTGHYDLEPYEEQYMRGLYDGLFNAGKLPVWTKHKKDLIKLSEEEGEGYFCPFDDFSELSEQERYEIAHDLLVSVGEDALAQAVSEAYYTSEESDSRSDVNVL